MPLIDTLLVGVGLYASTNIDDIFLNMAFFADPRLGWRSVVVGKFIGIGGLVLVSTVAAACALVIPREWVALLGLVPLGLGVKGLWELRRKASDGDGDGDGIGAAPSGMVAQVMAVAGVTAANGGDNLGIYVPVFAKDLSVVPIYVAVFAVMTIVWCVGGKLLVSHRLVAATMQRLVKWLLPLVLICLGLWILSGARALVMADSVGESPAAASATEAN